MYELMLDLDSRFGKNLYERIYQQIKDEIQAGNIRAGERLPSTRLLAAQLSVSRSTAQLAYDQLLSEGYIEAVPCRGYFVCRMDELYHLKQEPVPEEEVSPGRDCIYDFTPSGIELDHFPYGTWRKLYREVFREEQKGLLNLGDAKGELSFRKTICTYLHQARGVNVQPSQIILGSGNDYLLMLLSRMLDGERRIAMESPTYRHAYRIFERLGFDCRTVSMDRQGMDVKELKQSGTDIAYVMPSHQYPLGIVMPVGRRQELLQWAAEKPGRYIIEDDYDSEFRYVGKPIPALKGADSLGNVIYLGTFSRSIAPAIRISYLVLPPQLLERYEEVGRYFSCTVSRIDQRMVQLFMERGYFERHLNRMRAIYKRRRDLLLNEVKSWGCVKKILGDRAGVHILLELTPGSDERRYVELARAAGVKVYPLLEYCIDKKAYQPAILLGYATMSEETLLEAVRKLKEAWGENKKGT